MKQIYSSIFFALLALMTFAQNTVKRTPVYEVFSSSTCPPCKPANDYLVPQFEAREGRIAVVKYQMSWPGAGDPYYTQSGNYRRNYYGVNSVPAFFDNAISTSYSSFDTNTIDAELQEDVHMAMELRYMLNPDSQSVKIRARIEALDAYNAGAHRVIIAITEKVTYNNKETNGETEFHNVFKKMLPTAQGDFRVGALNAGDTIIYDLNYQFQGQYRLPQNSTDFIDDAIEHSVEDFSNLHVIMFMQSAESNKEIYQAANGVKTEDPLVFYRPWGAWPTSVSELQPSATLKIYPNPSSLSIVNIQAEEKFDQVTVFNLLGESVLHVGLTETTQTQLDVQGLKTGVYLVRLNSNSKELTKMLSIIR